ncbi:hypothetical protein GEMRC1_003479 [Eukaryota sp. GEM-RC1]
MSSSWIPLEANPDVLNRFISKLGVPSKYSFVDVFGLDPELLAFVPQPVRAVIFLFPITDKTETFSQQEEESLQEQDIPLNPPNVFYTKQTIPNACGTIATIHSILNNEDIVQELEDESWFLEFLNESKALTPEQRACLLEGSPKNPSPVASRLKTVHEEMSVQGQSSVPDAADPVWLHFVAFVNKDGYLYELDGRKSRPIVHQSTSEDSFLNDCADVARKFISRVDSIEFNMIALCKQE